MGIPATIEFLSSLRSSFQLLAIKNRIKTTTEKPKGMKLKFCSKYFYENIKTSVQGNFDSEKIKKNNNNDKTTNDRCYGRIFLERKFHLIPAHSIESYFKQPSQKINIKWRIVVICY